tara:strand:+ start:1109 stop:1309 length:201 start_codon:yes stop_codon:yes gene_type:complete
MSIKFKKSQKVRNRQTGKISVEHYYIKQISTKELQEYIEAPNSKKKIIQKCKNEIVRRNNENRYGK